MNTLIKNARVLLCEDGRLLTKEADIAITGNKISQIGKIEENLEFQKVIDAKNMLAMPGIINAHTHLAMILLRNYADDMPLFDWLTKKIWPLEANLTPELIYSGSILELQS